MSKYERLISPGEASTTFFERFIARRQLSRISKWLLEMDKEGHRIKAQTSADYDVCLHSLSHPWLGFVVLTDGVAVHYGSRGWLEDRSNRLILPDDGEPSYHREPYNIDCQALGSKRLDIIGTENIVADRNITSQLAFVESAVREISGSRWVDLKTSSFNADKC